MKELKILITEQSSDARNSPAFQTLCGRVSAKLPSALSAQGHDSTYWLENARLEVWESLESVRTKNISKLTRVALTERFHLAPDQADEVYAQFVGQINRASRFPDKAQRKLNRDTITVLVRSLSERSLFGEEARSYSALQGKLRAASVAEETILSAVELRRRFRAKRLQTGYQDGVRNDTYGEVMARLNYLKSQLDDGSLVLDGKGFHGRCLRELEQIAEHRAEGASGFAFLQGCMYDITNRCLHRFTAVTA